MPVLGPARMGAMAAERVSEPSTRERLVAATLGELDDKGYSALRVDDVARRAGLTTGAIYGVFRTKVELVATALSHRDPGALRTAVAHRSNDAAVQRMLDAAFGELDAKGYRRVRLAHVARRAGEPIAKLRRNFPTKNHLLATAIVSTDPEGFRDAAFDEFRIDDLGRRATPPALANDEESTRERLLACAMDELDANGYRGARVSSVARRAGLTTGAVYANFSSKDELLDAAMAERYGALFDLAMNRVIDPESDGLLSAVAAAMRQDTSIEHRALIEVIAMTTADDVGQSPLALELMRRNQQVQTLIDAGKSTGRVRTDMPTAGLARIVQLLALGNIVAQALHLPPTPSDELDTTIRILGDTLRPQ